MEPKSGSGSYKAKPKTNLRYKKLKLFIDRWNYTGAIELGSDVSPSAKGGFYDG
jgi:hypothetical protein